MIYFNKNKSVFLVLFVTCLAVFFRFYKLGEWSFWLDEIYTVEAALGEASSENLYQNYPISYWLIGAILSLLGTNEWTARLVPALVGAFSVPILYFISKRVVSTEVSLIAVLLLAISPWHIYWSQNARFYSLLLLFCTISIFTFYIGLEKDNIIYLVISLISLGLGVLTHTSAVLIVPGLVGYVFMLGLLSYFSSHYSKPDGFRFRSLLVFLIPGLVPLIYILYRLFFGATNLLPTVMEKVTLSPTAPLRLALAFMFYVNLTVICFAIVSLFYVLFVDHSRVGLMLVVNAITPFFCLLIISVFFFVFNRYIFMVLYVWILLAAYGLTQLLSQTRQELKILATGTLLLMLFIPLSENMLYYQYQHGNREDWRSAFEYVKQNYQPGDKVVVTFPAAGRYYFGDSIIDIRELYPQDIDSSSRYWFVENDAIEWGFPAQDWILNNSILLANYDVHVNSARIYKMRVLLYDPTEESTETK